MLKVRNHQSATPVLPVNSPCTSRGFFDRDKIIHHTPDWSRAGKEKQRNDRDTAIIPLLSTHKGTQRCWLLSDTSFLLGPHCGNLKNT